jgi:hypothetical protein
LRKSSRLASGLGRSQKLLAVLLVTTILVGAAAVVAYTIFFPPRFRGWGEVTSDGRVAGWAVDEYERGRRVEVQLYVDGRFVAAGVAELPRPDVLEAGRSSDEWCGYSFPLPSLNAGEHEARVYATHTVGGGAYRTLILTGKPLRFTVGEDGAKAVTSDR